MYEGVEHNELTIHPIDIVEIIFAHSIKYKTKQFNAQAGII